MIQPLGYDKRLTAAHEAGHALTAALLIDGVEWVTCEPGIGYDGRTQPVPAGPWNASTAIDSDGAPTPLYVQQINENKELFIASIKHAIAGEEAQILLGYQVEPSQVSGDRVRIRNLVNDYLDATVSGMTFPDELKDFENRIRQETRTYLIEHIAQLQRLADALFAAGRLTGVQVDQILGIDRNGIRTGSHASASPARQSSKPEVCARTAGSVRGTAAGEA